MTGLVTIGDLRRNSAALEVCCIICRNVKAGKSEAWICASLDIVMNTMVNWERDHREFMTAMEQAGMFSQQWWEDAGQDGMR